MIEIQNLSKSYRTASGQVEALKDVSITIGSGDIYGIIGMSGAGKSTLVRCINMLERPSQGRVLLDGQDLGSLSPTALRQVRRNVTMIFQSFNLLMQRTCLGNVCFPLELAGMKRAAARQRAQELLALVGLPDKAGAYPAQLSGGQQQRVAIARALATDPKVLLCDEATSALDPNTTHAILELIRDINRKLGITVVLITHQMSVVEAICNRVAILDEGTVVEEGEVSAVFSSPKSAAARRLVFPQYQEPSSALIRMYLGGEFGSRPGDVNPYAASAFYAVDRYASLKKVWGEYYSQGGLILTDRYTTSNAVHQGAKCAPQERPAFLGWLDDFEHDKLGLPRADLVLYLDMPTRCSLELLRSREAATHTQGDIHEVDPDYLAACRDSALQAARLLGWQVIPCVTGDGRLRTVEEIHREVWSLVSPLLNLN